jgi:hypothetical protein
MKERSMGQERLHETITLGFVLENKSEVID